MAAELVRRQAAVIVANTPGNPAAKAATTTIPIVFTTVADPVQPGFVASLSRPGGNMTGETQSSVEAGPKRVESAHGLVPAATIVGRPVNPKSPTLAEPIMRNRQEASRTLGPRASRAACQH